jgi:hypothetical protein
MNYSRFLLIALKIFLGGMLVYGSIGKFTKPNPHPAEVVERANKNLGPDKEVTLQKILYISGMKQTGFAWQVLGVSELLLGMMLLIQGSGLIAAFFSLPITFHIFLFHLFLEMDEPMELLSTGGMLLANILIIALTYNKWKHLIWIKP